MGFAMPDATDTKNPDPDFLWGARAIGRAIGLTERQAYHRLEAGHLSGAKKVGGTWVASARALTRAFEAMP